MSLFTILARYARQAVNAIYSTITQKNKMLAPLVIGSSTYLAFAFNTYKNKDKKGQSELFKKAIAGSLGIAITEVFLFPLDTINMKLKADHTGKSFMKMVKTIYQKDGFMGYCKGGQPLFYYTSFGGILYFYFYELFRKKMDDCNAAGLSNHNPSIRIHKY